MRSFMKLILIIMVLLLTTTLYAQKIDDYSLKKDTLINLYPILESGKK